MTKSKTIDIHHISKREMDALRKRFDIDHDPAVLSFPESKRGFSYPPGGEKPLGEIFLCTYYIKREAKERKIAPKDHEARLIAHGVLHLLGYTHDTDEKSREMEDIEERVFRNGDRKNRDF